MFLFEYFNYIKFQRVGKTFFQILKIKSSRPEVFSKKGVPKNSAKFTEKHLSLSLFWIVLQAAACHVFTFLLMKIGALFEQLAANVA